MEAGIVNNIDFEKLIADLGEALGMTIAFDEGGVCDLVVKESFGVSLKKSEEDGTLTMFSSLCTDLPEAAHGISEVEVGQVTNRLEVYLKLCAMPDGEEKTRKLEDFLQPENWKEVAPEDRKRVHRFFCAVFENAAMRQLTKMSVRFFNEEKIPAFFQYADAIGRSLNFRCKGEHKDWYDKNVAKEGRKHKIQDVRLHGGSPIAYTAIRYGVKAQAAAEDKVIAKLGEDYESKGIPIGKLPSHYYAFSDGFDEFVMPWQDEIRMNLNRNNV